MSRSIGGVDLIQGSIPEWLALVVALLTQLGDVWFLALLLAGLYWLDAPDRTDVAILAGVALTGMGVYRGLKQLLELGRPDAPLADPLLFPRLVRPWYEAAATAGGYGFPSGHAVNATVVYLGLASVGTIWTPRRRYVIAATLVAVVCLSRLALGVHYVVDVVAGVAIGLGALLLARRLFAWPTADRATVAFASGIGGVAFYLSASEWSSSALVLLAAGLGAFAGWQLVTVGRELTADRSRSSPAGLGPLIARAGVAVIAAAPLVAALEGSLPVALPSDAVLDGLAVAVVVVLPIVGRSKFG